ncbi:MAG: hypothetical protein ABL983_01095 [Nitrospira sp.]
MSSTSQVTTFEDLYTDLMNRVRVTTSVTATLEQAKRYINIALQDIHLGFDYKLPWCERIGYLQTKAPYSSGTVSVNKGSTTFTGSGTSWDTNNEFGVKNVVSQGKIIVAGSPNVYKVSSVTTNTALTARQFFIDTTVTDSDYTYFEDEYTLNSGFLHPIDFSIFSPAMGISLIPRSEFRRRYPVVNVSGRPRVACLADMETSATNGIVLRRAILYPYPDREYLIPYAFVTAITATTSSGTALTSMSSTTDAPTMPLRYRHVIVLHALASWYRDKKDDARAESVKAEYTDTMMRIVNDLDIATHTTARIQPSMGSYIGGAVSPYRSGRGRKVYDLNDDFDSFRR